MANRMTHYLKSKGSTLVVTALLAGTLISAADDTQPSSDSIDDYLVTKNDDMIWDLTGIPILKDLIKKPLDNGTCQTIVYFSYIDERVKNGTESNWWVNATAEGKESETWWASRVNGFYSYCDVQWGNGKELKRRDTIGYFSSTAVDVILAVEYEDEASQEKTPTFTKAGGSAPENEAFLILSDLDKFDAPYTSPMGWTRAKKVDLLSVANSSDIQVFREKIIRTWNLGCLIPEPLQFLIPEEAGSEEYSGFYKSPNQAPIRSGENTVSYCSPGHYSGMNYFSFPAYDTKCWKNDDCRKSYQARGYAIDLTQSEPPTSFKVGDASIVGLSDEQPCGVTLKPESWGNTSPHDEFKSKWKAGAQDWRAGRWVGPKSGLH